MRLDPARGAAPFEVTHSFTLPRLFGQSHGFMVARGLIYVGRNSNKFTQPFETMAADAAFAAAGPAAAEAPLLLAQPFPTTILQISQHVRLEKITNGKASLGRPMAPARKSPMKSMKQWYDNIPPNVRAPSSGCTTSFSSGRRFRD